MDQLNTRIVCPECGGPMAHEHVEVITPHGDSAHPALVCQRCGHTVLGRVLYEEPRKPRKEDRR